MQQRRMSGVMRMYEKLKTLKDKLQKMKTNRANRQIGQTFHFSPFSRKQKQVLTWWCKESPVHDMDGVIADGAIRSGKTISMSLSFVMWAMSTFTGQNFAMCGKTIGSFRRNVLFWLKLMLRSRGYSITDHRADNLLTIRKDGKENYFYIFGGKDERSQDLIQGITLAGVFFDEVALMPESFVNQATGRCSVKGSKFWFNCNPDGPYHWFKQNWIDKSIGYLGKEETARRMQQAAAEGKDPGLKDILYLHFTMDDNLSLDEEIKARYRSMYVGVFFKNLSAENTFMVKDDSIEENELFAVYYYIRKDDSEKLPDHYMATVVTTNYKYELDIENSNTIQATTEPAVPHYLGEIPIIEYLNNKLAIGDFELQIPLIDAYNALMSDRVTDKEQFIDAILAIYGTLLTDEDEPNTEDEDESIRKAKARLKKYKVLEMPDTAKAEYLTRTFDESGVEILKKAIEQDIHKFSHIPCMSDESFGGNVSGVAMEFKLLGMENITKIKTRYYKKGLRKRVRIFCNYLALHGISIDPSGITMTFTRALPKNLLEISQIVANLWGKVSRKTLLSQVPFVDDVDEELKALETEEEENLKRQQEVFGLQDNTPPEQDPDDKEKVDE